jgi:hypothetical protein
MSLRALAATAALLFVLCVVAAGLLVERLGWWDVPEPPELVFVNPTLGVVRGQRVVLRPILEGATSLRYTFLAEFREPRPDDEVAPVPHLRAGVEEREGGEWCLRTEQPVAALALCQMGALTAQEWLEEIRPVREVLGAGRERLLLRAQFGHQNGSTIAYYFDPERPVPAVGWTRSEMLAPGGRAPEVHFASDGGRVELPR